jgi:hypothetical protein
MRRGASAPAARGAAMRRGASAPAARAAALAAALAALFNSGAAQLSLSSSRLSVVLDDGAFPRPLN